MHIDVNGTRLWFDVDGSSLEPDGPSMRARPTLVLVHGGPGGYDHSYFKPGFAKVADTAQVVYLDLRDHGRSGRGDPAVWSFETCADDLHVFCLTLGIERPIVLGHSMGGFIVMLYGARHPDHAGGLILSSTMARFDLERLVEGFRRFGGDEVADIARRDYGGDDVTDDEWDRVYAAFGPNVLSHEELARRVRNPAVGEHGMELLRSFDVLDQLSRIEAPTLVCVGDQDPVTTIAAAREILDALPSGVGRLEVIEGAGHFAWKDDPDAYRTLIEGFVAEAGSLGGR
jgi:pimeloyl-ACP methyl ester carboxylesterase